MSLWNQLKDSYIPFLDLSEPVCVQLEEKDPSLWKNRWGREQIRIKVTQWFDDEKSENRALIGGKRLFVAIRSYLEGENCILSDGSLSEKALALRFWITRVGEGFDINYVASKEPHSDSPKKRIGIKKKTTRKDALELASNDVE